QADGPALESTPAGARRPLQPRIKIPVTERRGPHQKSTVTNSNPEATVPRACLREPVAVQRERHLAAARVQTHRRLDEVVAVVNGHRKAAIPPPASAPRPWGPL